MCMQRIWIFRKGFAVRTDFIARTEAGERTLAGWLLAPAPLAEALSRQTAVEELTSRLDLREDIALLVTTCGPDTWRTIGRMG